MGICGSVCGGVKRFYTRRSPICLKSMSRSRDRVRHWIVFLVVVGALLFQSRRAFEALVMNVMSTELSRCVIATSRCPPSYLSEEIGFLFVRAAGIARILTEMMVSRSRFDEANRVAEWAATIPSQRLILQRALTRWGEEWEGAAPDKAEATYGIVTHIAPDSVDAYWGLGRLHQRNRRYEDAISSFLQAIRVDSALSASGYLYVARIYQDQQRWSDSIRALRLAVARGSVFSWARDWEVAEAHLRLGEALIRIDMPEEALGEFVLTLELAPPDSAWLNGSASFRIGELYYRQGRTDEAMAVLRRGIQGWPTYVWNYVLLGKIHMEQGDPLQARSMFERALAIDPESAEAKRALETLGP